MSIRAKAIEELVPDANFTLYGNEISIWDSSEEQPSEEQIQTKMVEVQSDYDAKKYQRDRATAFPPLQEQLDMQYWDKVNGTNKWQEAVAKVKADNPKPE